MTRVAAIDCGTNSTRLLVADPGDPLHTVDRQMRVTRLGAAVDRTGRLDDVALDRTVDCIGGYHERAVRLGAEVVRIAATSAIRDAGDRDRFLTGVAERTGVVPEVLSGREEAATAFAGATRSVDGDPPYLVLDIGGGSTELIRGTYEPEASVSQQLGCVRLTERSLRSDPPRADEVAEARAVAARQLAEAAEAVGVAADASPSSRPTLVGVAGTVTTLAALHLRLEVYDAGRIHGTRLPAASVDELVQWLGGMTSAARAALGPMAPGREDVIIGGALVLQAALRCLRAEEVLVSESDILDGLALSLLES